MTVGDPCSEANKQVAGEVKEEKVKKIRTWETEASTRRMLGVIARSKT